MSNKNVSSKPKVCIRCSVEYMPTSNRQTYCPECIMAVNREQCRSYRARTFVKKGYDQAGEKNNNWKGGIGFYKTAYTLKDKVCELCGSDRFVVRHHKDHNRYHNTPDNIMYLCKKCHAKHHAACRKASKDTAQT